MTSIVDSISFRDGKRLGAIALDDVSGLIAQPGTFVWLGLHEPDDALLRKIQEAFGLHDLAIEDAHHAHQRPKIESYSDSLFIVLKTAQLEAGQVVYGETHLFVGTNFLVSVRHGASSSYAQVLQRFEDGTRRLSMGPGLALYAVLDFVADHYQPVVAQFEKDFDAIETDIFRDRFDRLVIERLYALKRRTTVLRHAVAPLMEVAGKLHGGRVPEVCTGAQEYFRDVHDHLSRINGAIDTIRDTIGTAIQVNLSMVTIEESETTKRLAAWAAIFAVSTALAGIWGMNFEHMPELKWAFGYPAALAVIFCSGAVLYWRFRKTGWL